MNQGFNARTLILVSMAVGALLFGWLGSLIDHHPFTGIFSATFGSAGALLGAFLGNKLSQSL